MGRQPLFVCRQIRSTYNLLLYLLVEPSSFHAWLNSHYDALALKAGQGSLYGTPSR